MDKPYRDASPYKWLDQGGNCKGDDVAGGEDEEATESPAQDAEARTLTELAASFARSPSTEEGTLDLLPVSCAPVDGQDATDFIVCKDFYRLLRLPGQSDFEGAEALTLAAGCLTALGAKERGQTDGLQKASSLRGRWFAQETPYDQRLGEPEAVGGHHLHRDDVIRHGGKYYRILTVFAKGSGKWRVSDPKAATAAVRVHGVQVRTHCGSFEEDDDVPVAKRYK
eukprot:GHVU01046974.1.p1 GENE.GHVU01046974.1~~GHVU01046974.1.p1  ORF type:complete len:246 (+),score=44.97 GHVU01046974.1:66-740(+)